MIFLLYLRAWRLLFLEKRILGWTVTLGISEYMMTGNVYQLVIPIQIQFDFELQISEEAELNL